MTSRTELSMHKSCALILLALSCGTASACSCALQTLDDFTRDADTIYMATLLEAKYVPGEFVEKWPRVEGKYRIDKILKGKVSQRFVTLETDSGGSDCSIRMIVASKYVVFKDNNDGFLRPCSGSSAIESFQEPEIVEKIAASVKRSSRKNKTR